jgi:nucleoside-diphosphate-sugar epimerase
MLDVRNPTTMFSEQTWNPADMNDIHRSKGMAYMIAKTLAERAAWDYVRGETPSFDLVTVNPPLVLGPLLPHLATVDSINMSNASLADLIRGKWKEKIPPAGPVNVWVDVRDVAAAHVGAMERSEAGGKRLFTVGGRFTNAMIAEIMRAGSYPFQDRLPGKEIEGDAGAKGISYNNDETNKILDIDWISLDKTIADFVQSIRGFDL